MSQCIRNLFEPIVAADRLQEFGASYAEMEGNDGCQENNRIPLSYWDRLSVAITSTANEFLENQTTTGLQ